MVSEIYYPDTTSTGHILTGIAEGLAERFSVRVICGQPRYAAKGARSPWRERRNGVVIHRCWGTTWNKDVFLRRLANLVTISLSLFVGLLWRLRRDDRVLVVTNPPLLPFLISLACRLRKANCVLLIHDVYPEAAIAAGLLRQEQLFTRLLNAAMRRLYRSMTRIVVIGRDMGTLVGGKCAEAKNRIVMIPSPADLNAVEPQPRAENPLLRRLELLDKFVIQCAGNMGPLHGMDLLLQCAVALRDNAAIHFVFVGGGAKKASVERFLRDNGLDNVTLLPPFAREESSTILGACDVAISAFVPGMLGVSVPSRACNTFAAGKPIIAVSDRNSELACVLHEEQIGWTSEPGDLPSLIRVVSDVAATPPDVLAAMGRRARAVAERDYAWPKIIDAYAGLLDHIEPR